MRIFLSFLVPFLVASCAFSGTATEEPISSTSETDGSLLEFALSRDKATALIVTDPKTADAFWRKRDKEIDLVLDHIENARFESVAHKLKAMVQIDQSLRQLFTLFDQKRSHFESDEEFELTKAGLVDRILRVDTFNTDQIKLMLKDRGWFRDDFDGPNAAYNAWLITQHADRDPDFQREALKMIEQSLEAPGVSKRNYAYLFDRVARKGPNPQKYGTQGRCVGPGLWEPFEIEDADNLDQRRLEAGLDPMSEYIARFKEICP